MRVVLAAALVLAALGMGCVSVEAQFLRPPTPLLCRDGKPVLILQHPDCTNGVCGYSCVPGRWDLGAR
jgi:hypothetical protein